MTNHEPYGLGLANGAEFCRFWSAHVDALERHLDRMDQAIQTQTLTKTKTKKTRRDPKPERDKGEKK